MRTIIIDDEIRSIEILEYYLNEFFPAIEIAGKYTSVQAGLAGIIKHDPEVLFLDILMPELDGISLFEQIGSKNRITIFITAHKEYAIDAIQLGAFDYLLKPVTYEDLNRVYLKIEKELGPRKDKVPSKIKIKMGNKHLLFKPDEIVNVSSEGNYSTIFFEADKPLILTKNLKKVQAEFFSESPFFRVHQSNIINLNHVKEFSAKELRLSNEKTVPVSSKKYKRLEQLLSQKKHLPND